MAQAVDRHYPGTPGTPLYVGIDPPTSGELRLITTRPLRSLVGSAQSDVPVTFGQVFDFEDFDPATESLYGKVDDVLVPLQIDAISSHKSGGKARLGVISATLPSLPGSGTKNLQILAGDKVTPAAGTFNTDTWNPVFTLTLSGGAVLTASPRAQLLAQITAGTGLLKNGPVAKELELLVPLKNTSNVDHATLSLRLHVRLYASGRIKTTVIGENGWLLVSSVADQTYSLTCTQGAGGATIFSFASFVHHRHARWVRSFWQGGEPQVRARLDRDHFFSTTATWHYNKDAVINEAALAAMQTSMNGVNTGPMGWGLLNRYMPNTGGRPEIAPVPQWTAMYLISEDERAYNAMIANSIAAASAPMHFRDEATGLPTVATNRPEVTFDEGTSSPTIPRPTTASGWTVDRAHQGAFNYIPYVITGDHFHLEEQSFWASYNTMALNPGLKGTNRNLLYSDQVRGQAWSTRSLLEAVFALPDSHALKPYFRQAVDDNAAWQGTNYGNASGNAWVSALGGVISQYDNWRTPEYQADFFAYVWSWAIENKETGFQTVFNNTCRYTVGRFSLAAQQAGFCTSSAAGAWLWTRTTPGNVPITTWGAYYSRNYGSAACGTTAQPSEPGYPDWGGGYAAVARGALAAAQNAGYPGAAEVYARWVSFTPLLGAAYLTEPFYYIVPR